MKLFYAMQTANLAANPPPCSYHAIVTPGAPNWSLIIIDEWPSHQAQDTWEAIPGTIELHIWNWGKTVPAQMVTAFGPWGVVGTDTIEQAFRKVRAQWPECRANH